MNIAAAALQAVRDHATEGYPHEICGFLIGPRGNAAVTESRRANNIVRDLDAEGHGPHDRYLIDPRDQLRIDRECEAAGLEVLGYYHSHPDHPARASATDAEAAWPGLAYLIVSVLNGRAEDANAFVAEQYGGPLNPVSIDIV